MRRSQVALVTVVLAATSSATAVASAQQPSPARQGPPALGAIAGSVSDVANGNPIRAEVSIDRPRRAVRTDSAGRFTFRDVPVGTVRVRATSFGFEPTDTTVVVRAASTLTVVLRMRVLPQSLAPVNTIAKTPERGRFEEQATPSVVSISGAEVRRVSAKPMCCDPSRCSQA